MLNIDCFPNPCQNGGACAAGSESYTCICTAGFEGTNCEKSYMCSGSSTTDSMLNNRKII